MDLNLIEEALNLACHGARAQDQNFNIALERDLDNTLAPIEVVPQDEPRVFLNLIGDGFYAANKRSREAGDDFRPLLQVGLCLVGRSPFTILPPRKIAPKCDLPHIHRNCLRIRSRRQRLAGYRRLHRATRCEQLRKMNHISSRSLPVGEPGLERAR